MLSEARLGKLQLILVLPTQSAGSAPEKYQPQKLSQTELMHFRLDMLNRFIAKVTHKMIRLNNQALCHHYWQDCLSINVLLNRHNCHVAMICWFAEGKRGNTGQVSV